MYIKNQYLKIVEKFRFLLKKVLHHFAGYNLARFILGRDYITIEEMATVCHFVYTDEQLKHFADTLPDKKLLLWLRLNSYILMPGPPKKPEHLWFSELSSYIQHVKYLRKNTNNDRIKTGEWLAIRKKVVSNSFNRPWKKRKNLITKFEYIPNADEVAYTIAVYRKVRGICLIHDLLPCKSVRTSSLSIDDKHIHVGYTDTDELTVKNCPHDDSCECIYIITNRKLTPES